MTQRRDGRVARAPRRQNLTTSVDAGFARRDAGTSLALAAVMRSALLLLLLGCASQSSTVPPTLVEPHQTVWFRCPSIGGPSTSVVMVADHTGAARPVVIDASMQANVAWYCGYDPGGVQRITFDQLISTAIQPPRPPRRPLAPATGVHDAPVKPVYTTATATVPAPRPTLATTAAMHTTSSSHH
jgi:hypothetical protein